ncbi:hypothetical protein ACPCG0_12145 [Propionibacteriaceae bacterium Y1923]
MRLQAEQIRRQHPAHRVSSQHAKVDIAPNRRLMALRCLSTSGISIGQLAQQLLAQYRTFDGTSSPGSRGLARALPMLAKVVGEGISGVLLDEVRKNFVPIARALADLAGSMSGYRESVDRLNRIAAGLDEHDYVMDDIAGSAPNWTGESKWAFQHYAAAQWKCMRSTTKVTRAFIPNLDALARNSASARLRIYDIAMVVLAELAIFCARVAIGLIGATAMAGFTMGLSLLGFVIATLADLALWWNFTIVPLLARLSRDDRGGLLGYALR